MEMSNRLRNAILTAIKVVAITISLIIIATLVITLFTNLLAPFLAGMFSLLTVMVLCGITIAIIEYNS